jgi:hypothetical protein
MKPTLFICIGGSGMKIGHALKYNFATYKPELLLSPDGTQGRIKFLFIENDINEIERTKPFYRHKEGIFNRDEFIQVGNINSSRIVERIKKNIAGGKKLSETDADINLWVDKTINFPDAITEIGLAACRQIGRIAFASSYDYINSIIKSATTSLVSIANKENDGKTEPNSIEIFIITGICGGTGSSMFLDIAALLDEALGINQSPLKKAVLINTNYFLEQKLSDPNISKTHDQYINLQMNSAALINESEFFINNKDNTLLGKYAARSSKHKNRVETGYAYSPFSSAFIFDIHTHNQRKIPLSNFYYVVADMLFYTSISQTSKKFASDIEANTTVKGTDADNREKVQYSTLALNVVRYPREEFLEYFQQRYLFEVFSKCLLKKSIKSIDVTKKAQEFVNNVFEDTQNSVFAGVASDYKTRLTKYQNLNSLFTEAQYLNENGKLVKKEEIFDIINNYHQRTITEIKEEMEQKRRSMPDLGFKSRYKGNPTVADQLRKNLYKFVKEVIYSHGYFGILGINEGTNIEAGFLNEIERMSRTKYKDLTNFKTSFNESDFLNAISNAKSELIDSLSKFRIKLSYNKIKPEIDAYHEAIYNYLQNLYLYNLTQLKQEILYYFVVGDRKSDIIDSFYSSELENSRTELSIYHERLASAVGCSPNKNNFIQSIISVFDKGSGDDSNTIRNNFVKFLPNRWNSTRDDLFTVYIPVNLYDYTDSESSDNWKPDTDLDNKFKNNITINYNELSAIFDGDPEINNLLSELGMDQEKINRNIKLIIEKINDYFLGRYIKNSTHPISEFINKTIQDAYNDGTPDIKKKIKDQKNSLVYPVCDSTTSRIPVPYLNIHPSNKEFAINQLEFNKEKLIEQDSMPKHQLALVGIVQGIDFHSISGNAEIFQVYKDRNLKIFRPHLHYEWNDYVMGPYEALREISIETGASSTYKYSDAILISYFFEKLIEVKPEIEKLVFVESDRTLTTKNGKRSTPVTYNKKTGMFLYFSQGDIIEENEIEKFYVQKSNINPEGINLGKLFKNLEFENAVKSLNKDDNFAECFNNFITVIKENKAEIIKHIDDKVNDTVSQVISDTKIKLEKVLHRNRNKNNISVKDQNFISQFSEKTKELIDELLEINLDL